MLLRQFQSVRHKKHQKQQMILLQIKLKARFQRLLQKISRKFLGSRKLHKYHNQQTPNEIYMLPKRWQQIIGKLRPPYFF